MSPSTTTRLATVGGALLSALGYLSQPQVLAILPPKAAAVVTAVGGVLVAFGIHTGQQQTHRALEQVQQSTAQTGAAVSSAIIGGKA